MEMNGIISVAASRSSLSLKQITASVAGGICLFAGFALGLHLSLHPQTNVLNDSSGASSRLLTAITPIYFRSETVEFSKISWMVPALKKGLHEKEQNLPELAVNLKFTPYVLPVETKVKTHHFAASFAKKLAVKNLRKHSAFYDLRVAYLALQKLNLQDRATTLENNQIEYQHAVEKMQSEFLVAMNRPLNSPAQDALANTTSSASGNQLVGGPQNSDPPGSALIGANSDTQQHKKKSENPVAEVNLIPAPTIQKSVATEKPVEIDPNSISQNGIIPSTQNAGVKEAKEGLTTQTEAVTTTSSSAIEYIPRLETDPKVEKQQAMETGGPGGLIITDPAKIDHTIAFHSLGKTPQPAVSVAKRAIAPPASLNSVPETKFSSDESAPALDETDSLASTTTQNKTIEPHSLTDESGCKTLPNHVFQLGDSQICPEHKEWISKDWKNSGWVKVESSEHLPTVTLHPAPNHGSTLLLNNNALKLLALRSGIQIAKGTGIILGRVPNGFKIEFTGRAEETQYFDFKGNEYFAVLNAEPSAGVIQLVGQSANASNSTVTSSVFTPVFEDTITFLDLVAPVQTSISVKIVKNEDGEKKSSSDESDIAGLTVGLSTQTNFQAITQKDGQATLKNVFITPGFPVFIDVSSKHNQEQSYTYRYQLKAAGLTSHTKTTYVLRQQDESLMHHYLKQVKQGLSDQSAMIVGSVARNRLDGFRNRYFVKTVAKSASFGLEPKDYSILWDGKISDSEPLEGDQPYFMSVQVPEGLSQIQILNEAKQIVYSTLIPISPRVIHVVSE
jgi:hypothetical protein